MSEKANIVTNIQQPGATGLLINQRGSTVIDYAVILVFTVAVVVAIILSLEDKASLVFTATEDTVGNFGKME